MTTWLPNRGREMPPDNDQLLLYVSQFNSWNYEST
jgi:hypothetical protein